MNSEPESAAPPTDELIPAAKAGLGRVPLFAAGFVLASLIGALLFLAGFLAAGGIGSGTCAVPSEAFEAFCDAYDRIQSQFVDEVPDESLVDGAIRGMFEFGVGDPYSSYMTPEQYQNSLDDLSGTFSGIGAEMGVENLDNPDDLNACVQLSETCALVVVSPIAGAPAEEAGLRSGDRITAVDGESVNGGTIQDQVAKVRGPAGSTVTLTIERDGGTFDLEITRAEIVVEQVSSRMVDGHVGYVALAGFSGDSPAQVHDAIQALLDEGADAFVLDLRGNPGGYITAAQEIASEFVSEGTIFTQESAGDEEKTWEATAGGLLTDPSIEVVVLIDGGSASASEIVAAALQEHTRVVTMGQPTFGKNTVQVWEELSNGGGVRITISRWFTPDHDSVAPDGVQPDIFVDVPDDTPPDQDPVLDQALEYLAGLAAVSQSAAA